MLVAAVGVVGAIGTIVAVYEDHSDYDDHSDYSDADIRRKREEAAREKKRKEDLDNAKQEMDDTLRDIRNLMANEASGQRKIFSRWPISANDFGYKNLSNDYDKLDSQGQERMRRAVEERFCAEENQCREELEQINTLLNKIMQIKLGNK